MNCKWMMHTLLAMTTVALMLTLVSPAVFALDQDGYCYTHIDNSNYMGCLVVSVADYGCDAQVMVENDCFEDLEIAQTGCDDEACAMAYVESGSVALLDVRRAGELWETVETTFKWTLGSETGVITVSRSLEEYGDWEDCHVGMYPMMCSAGSFPSSPTPGTALIVALTVAGVLLRRKG